MTKEVEIVVPADKSISHRAIILGALSAKTTKIYNPLISQDTLATLDCIQKLGASVYQKDNYIEVSKITKWNDNTLLDCANSGTTMRLLTGVVASIPTLKSTLQGDQILCRRPMRRIISPLALRGGQVCCQHGGYAPLHITGVKLQALDYTLPIPSAQVKSCLLLSGLNANGTTTIVEPTSSRNHTELMLKAMQVDIVTQDNTIVLNPSVPKSVDIDIAGDISSAAFWLVLGAISPNTKITLKNLNLNPTRTGILDVFDQVGVDYCISNIKTDMEISGDITVSYNPELRPFVVGGDLIPRLIDELPILCLLACFCNGQSTIRDASELRTKESDRISTTVSGLKELGADIVQTNDGMSINRSKLKGGAIVQSHGDHRIAMTMMIAGAVVDNVVVTDSQCVAISYPEFATVLKRINK